MQLHSWYDEDTDPQPEGKGIPKITQNGITAANPPLWCEGLLNLFCLPFIPLAIQIFSPQSCGHCKHFPSITPSISKPLSDRRPKVSWVNPPVIPLCLCTHLSKWYHCLTFSSLMLPISLPTSDEFHRYSIGKRGQSRHQNGCVVK